MVHNGCGVIESLSWQKPLLTSTRLKLNMTTAHAQCRFTRNKRMGKLSILHVFPTCLAANRRVAYKDYTPF